MPASRYNRATAEGSVLPRFRRIGLALLAAGLQLACGGSPITPPPPPPPPPVNSVPVIESIAVQGRRPRQPARFADLRETVDVTAAVRDAETPLDQLVYQWTATVGTFSGTGPVVTWTAPETAATPAAVTITLRVVENYGHPGQPKSYSQAVTGTQTIALHDSAREVGDMARRFLTEFSKPQTNQDWSNVMKDFDFTGTVCPDPRTVESERLDVVFHYSNFFMHKYDIGPATVSVNFGRWCEVPQRAPKPADACAAVPVNWDSTFLPDGTRGMAAGIDYISAAYSPDGSRWWLCSSDFPPVTTQGYSFYSSGR